MLTNQRSKFQIPSGHTYLNCAYMSPLAKAVEKAGIEGLLKKRNPFSISSEDFFTEVEALRKEFSKLIKCSAQDVAIIPSASYGLSTVAKNISLKKGDEIIILSEQFPSNVYPWKVLAQSSQSTLKIVEAPKQLALRGKIWNEKILDAISPKTKVVALGHVHWADGTLFDLQAIRKRTNEVGAYLIIDGTQSVGALAFDVTKIKPDALICAGYKWLMGPYAIGLAYFGERFYDGKPLEENWISRKESEDFTSLVNYQNEYQPGNRKFDVGERSNFILVPMMLAALQMINAWKPKQIQHYIKRISKEPIAHLQEHDWWVEDEKVRAHHLFGIRPLRSVDWIKIKSQLVKEKIAVSFCGNSMRIAPHVYNSEKELWKLVNVLCA